MDHPQAGQKAAFAGMAVAQCGHTSEAGFGGLDNSPPIALLSAAMFLAVVFPAVVANPVNLKSVARGQIMVLAADLPLDFSHLGREEFHRGAAFGAHHVVMAAPVVLMLVAGNAVMEGDFAGESAPGQKLQRAVDSGEADAGIFLLDQAVQFIGRKMLASFEKRAQDRVALPRLLQTYAAEMLQENGLCLADALARDAGLIVDSLL